MSVTTPHPGFYLLALVPKGWATPCQITRDDDGRYGCVIDGEPQDGLWTPEQIEQMLMSWVTAESTAPIVRLILYGKPTTESVYNYRLAYKDWARANRPDHPCLFPRKPINIRQMAPDEF